MDATRRRLICSTAIALLGLSEVRAQQASRIMRVAMVPVGGWSRRTEEQRLKSRQSNAKLFADEGFTEGRNLALEYVDLDAPDTAEVERRARAVIARRPDAILVGGDNIALFKRLTSEIPLIFYWLGSDPVDVGLVESYRRPGGNVTGIMFSVPGSDEKDWELLKELAPKARRIGLMWYEDQIQVTEPWYQEARKLFSEHASRLGFECVDVVTARNAGYPAVERAIRSARIDVLIARIDPSSPWLPEFMRFLERSRIPAAWAGPAAVRRGGLLSSQPNWDVQYRLAVTIVARVLRGANPATIPVQAPTSFYTAINLRTARAMGLTVPPSILLKADEVVE